VLVKTVNHNVNNKNTKAEKRHCLLNQIREIKDERDRYRKTEKEKKDKQ
jgi:hypothetical protein